MDHHTKGKSLEAAVKFIQETILESDPALRGSRFTIDTNVIVTGKSGRSEIDVVVKTHKDSNYEAAYIFECKNWKKPVGKNEVVLLAHKVHVTSANRGFLVAREITKDATAQIATDSRLKFLRCSDDFWSPLNSLELIHYAHELLAPTVHITFRQPIPDRRMQHLDPEKVVCKMKGDQVDFVEFMNQAAEKIAREGTKDYQGQYQHSGTHWTRDLGRILFRPGDLTLDGRDVAYVSIPVGGFMTTQRKRIVSKFQIDGQGQVFEFEQIATDDPKRKLDIHLVARFAKA